MTFRTLASSLALGAMLALGVAAAQAQIAPGDSGAGIKLGMLEQQNSGQVGEVTLYPRGARTLVVIDIKGEPAGNREPAHVHRGKSITCDDVDPKPAYALHDVVSGRSTTLVQAPIDKLLSGNYSVNVHWSAQHIPHYVSCGHLYR